MVQTLVQVLNVEARVVELINVETKQWNQDLVLCVLGAEVAEIVFKIPISVIGARDRLMWLEIKDGQFIVRSAYHKQKELVDLQKGQSSHHALWPKNWTYYWKLHIPNATKVFMWRACLESLLTSLNLYKKKIVDSPLCPICGREEESTTHALWSCPSAMDVWSQGPKVFQKSSNSANCFKDLVEQFNATSSQNLLALISMITKGIWQRRNNSLFKNSFIHPTQVGRQAVASLENYKATQPSSKNMTQQV
ncbi:uncharacterized protein LOC122310447 [Carya illinoinensis]|uniref:uncharacterized protein LOC122310447 n=1 Tax=Carya illinoinensis TaxID=32201 RepID=UPI001C71E9B0|nr:uncharacterized protein LOC122310447 [Carya illinoinensis]